MLSGSAILRLFLLVVAAAGIAGFVQTIWLGRPHDPAAPLVDAPAPAPPAPERTPSPAPVRTVSPVEPPAVPAAEAPPPPLPAQTQTPPPPAAPAPVAQAAPAPPERDPVAEAEENAPPAAIALVDLNTASLAELNGLKGGGSIGRAIIQHRPYASVEQLLSKRVLNRATYQRIKDQVMVR
ncbi:MAG TPA: helix-hairpin-helix domain-containing protein [Methylorubrum populi]|uniref:Helix-hairpin-helix domain-containing protein n=1 Tax=Methylorubrum populi TaxID=223967 RepID=A0A921E4U6_9HYPH|nr:helix-hairpin-helix domain-containing protein [Methylorubrum populi]